jgi:LacI family transcriptional regulator
MNDREVTLVDIAKALKISESTVSRALQDHPAISQQTKNRVQKVAIEYGYRMNTYASNLAKKAKSRTIGIVVHKLNSSFITSALSAIESVTAKAGYDLLIAQSSEDYLREISNVHNLFNKRVDGLIASLVYSSTNLDHFQPYVKKGIPIVFFDRVDKTHQGSKIIIDNFKSGYQAGKHLVEQGCKNIVIITAGINGKIPELRITGSAERYAGFLKALDESGQALAAQNLVIMDFNQEDDGIKAARMIANFPTRPDGLFITNDFHAITCMQELIHMGLRVPEDIAIVGFNNDFMGRVVTPTLTTIDNPATMIGEIAAKHLIQQLNGNLPIATDNTVVVSSQLIVRASSQKKLSE